jgi:putative ABC transport system permease protein
MMIPVGNAQAGTIIGIEGDQSYAANLGDEHAAGVHTEYNVVSPGYFQTMKIPLLRGRDFTDADREGATNVAIIDDRMARRYFAGADPLGRHFRDEGKIYEIIGVAESGSYRALNNEPRPFVYLPFAQRGGAGFNMRMVLHVRSRLGAGETYAAIRREVALIDKNVPLQEPMPVSEYMKFSLLPQRIMTAVAGVFGLTGLLLAALGIFGMVSYSVAQRTHEIGVRMALGARSAHVLKLILRQGLRVTLIGVATGLAGAFAATRLLESLLFGLSATDAVVFVGVSLLLTLVALAASYIPARRATKVDPMVALRYE